MSRRERERIDCWCIPPPPMPAEPGVELRFDVRISLRASVARMLSAEAHAAFSEGDRARLEGALAGLLELAIGAARPG